MKIIKELFYVSSESSLGIKLLKYFLREEERRASAKSMNLTIHLQKATERRGSQLLIQLKEATSMNYGSFKTIKICNLFDVTTYERI